MTGPGAISTTALSRQVDVSQATLFEEESMDLGAMPMTNDCFTRRVDPEGLVLHSDNGGPMKGATMLATLQRLGVVPSFKRWLLVGNAHEYGIHATLG
jgi:hypothetical protein